MAEKRYTIEERKKHIMEEVNKFLEKTKFLERISKKEREILERSLNSIREGSYIEMERLFSSLKEKIKNSK